MNPSQQNPTRAAAAVFRAGRVPFSAETLGDKEFRRDHSVALAYVAGAMFKGIASEDFVLRMAKARLLAFFGTGGLKQERIEAAIHRFRAELAQGQSYGMNLICNLVKPDLEEAAIRLFLREGMHRIEAGAYTQLTPWLALYRAKGLHVDAQGSVTGPNHILAKLSHPEVARAFLSPVPEKMLQRLVSAGELTPQEARLAEQVPVADDVCVEADSGGHTDQGVAWVLVPVITSLRDECARRYGYAKRPRVGTAGGLGTPQAVASAFLLGADFVLTGSINQCTAEAGQSDLVKDMLAEATAQDTEMAPAGDMFEIGAKVQVLKRGVFFPARANRLYDLYRQYNAWEEISPSVREHIEKQYFNRPIAEVWAETEAYYQKNAPEQLRLAERNAKHKLAMIVRWYFVQTNRYAQAGVAQRKVDFQIHCGPAMGAFNHWVKDTPWADWRKRHADEIAWSLMRSAAEYLEERVEEMRADRASRAVDPAVDSPVTGRPVAIET